MANAVLIEDATGDVVDVRYYCSDVHARDDEDYAGWYGCTAPSVDVECPTCGEQIRGEE